MPNEGPDPSSTQREKFAEYLTTKGIIESVHEVRPGIFSVKKRGNESLTVQLVDIYTVSESDVVRLIGDEPDVSAIVTASVWNGYTNNARAVARAEGVGLFKWREFMGAIHRDGDQFLDYRGQ